MSNKQNILIMHSKVFQISTERIEKENYLDENTLYGQDFFDYCMDCSERQRQEAIDALCHHILPKGMFTLAGDSILRYEGGADKAKQEWVERIRAKAELVTEENVLQYIGAAYQLKKEIENPFNTYSRFYIDGVVEQSEELLRIVCGLEPGTLLFIGGVIDYHF